jgi:hypothetical protein
MVVYHSQLFDELLLEKFRTGVIAYFIKVFF